MAFIEQKICESFDQDSLTWCQVSERRGNIFALQLIPPILASINFLTVLEILTTLFTLSFCIMSLRKFLQHDCTCPEDYPIIHIYQSYVFCLLASHLIFALLFDLGVIQVSSYFSAWITIACTLDFKPILYLWMSVVLWK